jgi:glycosyltransferase involved in cell wall biosynthesis
MKIGINAICFNERPSGAKQRFIGIYNELFKLLNNDEFIIYESSDCQLSNWFDKADNVTFHKTPLNSTNRFQKYFGGLFYWPSVLKTEKFDLFEVLSLPLVHNPAGHTILTIHDIRKFSLYGNWIERVFYKAFLKKALSATRVVTVSKTIENEILEHYPNTSISVIYNGIDIEQFENIPASELLIVQQALNLPEDFLLTVGHFEPRKNYPCLIDAIDILHKQGHLVSLVIIGNDSGEMNTIKEKIHSLGLTDYVRIFNGLSDREVCCVYNLCKLFVFPSIYEGFGIPILEAMAAKRPLVMSDISVFQEITQGQGAYFSPNDSSSIAQIINEVLFSTSEIERLIKYGNERVQDFSFKKISIELASLYKSFK